MKHVLLVTAAAVLTACSSQPAPAPTAQQPAATDVTITATSKSPEAVAHFKKGEELFDNLRTTEASDEFDQALKLDSGFVLAHA
jgi:uncharacterized lipoprotein YmbA